MVAGKIDGSMRLNGRPGRGELAEIFHFFIKTILQYGNLVFQTNIEQPFPMLMAGCYPSGIVEIWNRVNETDFSSLKDLLQIVQVHSIGFHGDS